MKYKIYSTRTPLSLSTSSHHPLLFFFNFLYSSLSSLPFFLSSSLPFPINHTYLGEPNAFPLFDDFITGYSKHGELTFAEVKAIPDLINLRVLSNVVYFVGRSLGGEDSIASLTTRAKTYSGRVNWIKENKEKIIEIIDKKMRTKMGTSY